MKSRRKHPNSNCSNQNPGRTMAVVTVNEDPSLPAKGQRDVAYKHNSINLVLSIYLKSVFCFQFKCLCTSSMLVLWHSLVVKSFLETWAQFPLGALSGCFRNPLCPIRGLELKYRQIAFPYSPYAWTDATFNSSCFCHCCDTNITLMKSRTQTFPTVSWVHEVFE